MKVYLNGSYIDDDQALISVFDRGFLYGDGLFETIKSLGGRHLLLKEHIKRLREGLKEFNIQIKEDYKDFKEIITNLLMLNKLEKDSVYVRITVSRGLTSGLKDFQSKNPTVFIFVRKIDDEEISSLRKKGLVLKTVPFYRSFLPHFKHLNYLPSVYALMRNRDCDEIIFTDEKENILEGATSNIFFVNDGEVHTPKNNLLCGVYRGYVIETLKKLKIKVFERDIKLSELSNFASAFITNSVIEIMPVRKINDIEFSNYRYHPSLLISKSIK